MSDLHDWQIANWEIIKGGYKIDPVKCPDCGEEAHAEYVDIGVGMQQVTPYSCACGAEEMDWRYKVTNATQKEIKANWFLPSEHKADPLFEYTFESDEENK